MGGWGGEWESGNGEPGGEQARFSPLRELSKYLGDMTWTNREHGAALVRTDQG